MPDDAAAGDGPTLGSSGSPPLAGGVDGMSKLDLDCLDLDEYDELYGKGDDMEAQKLKWR